MDDVDAVQAQIARNMLASGDWVTARIDGVPYLEKGAADLLDDRDLATKFSACTIGRRAFPWRFRPSGSAG